MNRRRLRERTDKAIALLMAKEEATALDLGNAAVRGEGSNIPMRDRESIGFVIATALMRRGVVKATRNNTFFIP